MGAAENPAGEAASGPRILVADDDPDILRLLKRRLRHRGYDVVTATDGSAALEVAISLRLDAVVLDWVMPGMEGDKVCEALRDRDDTRDLPIVLLTAKAADADLEQGTAAGASAYLVKPFMIDELDRTLRELIDVRRHPGD